MLDFAARLKRMRVGDRLVRRNPIVYGRAISTFEALSCAGLEARRQWTEQRLDAVLARARTTAYGKSLGHGSNLADWPLLSKADVQSSPQSFCVNGLWPVSRATTGGTTGSPLSLVRSLTSVAAEQAAMDFAVSRMDIDAPRARVAVLRADYVKDSSDRRPPYWIYAAGGSRLVLSSQHLTSETLPLFLREIEAFSPDIMWVYPSALESLCLLLQRATRSLLIPRVLSSSEVLSTAAWRLAEDMLGCRLIDYYGQAERVAFSFAAAPCAHRFLPGYSCVELIPVTKDAHGSQYEIVGTSLWNDAMPLVRYRTGDTLHVSAAFGSKEVLEIAYGVRDFDGVVGRCNEFLISPDGARIIGLNHFPKGTQHVIRLQVIQEALDEVLVLVVASAGFNESDQEILRRNIRMKVPGTMNVKIRVVDSLETTRSGKAPFVIRRPKVTELNPA